MISLTLISIFIPISISILIFGLFKTLYKNKSNKKVIPSQENEFLFENIEDKKNLLTEEEKNILSSISPMHEHSKEDNISIDEKEDNISIDEKEDNISIDKKEIEIDIKNYIEINNNQNNLISIKENHLKKVIMIIGETGTGKSSFLNELSNAIENNTIDNLKVYFKLLNFSDINKEVDVLFNDKIKFNCQSNIVHTKVSSIIRSKSSKNIDFILIDTPGMVCERDGSIDMQFIECIEELFNFIENIDYLVFIEKSDKISCQRSIVKTISEFILRYKNKISKVLPVFSFYPGSLVFDQKNFPFPKEMCYKEIFKCNNLIFDFSDDEWKQMPEKKSRKIYTKSQKKMMKIIDLISN
ncbi:hypothetical protein SteCoe_33352 [Stentor coeruleus]|uniref:G domain-containing protein n=1 Tax=Stentor coeruleus TaxID=5963 RepID=A0A1R2AWY1_9CILI|nr:hypothetical protein SteCoe_33352 [Stentor coeruleus]